MRRFAACCVVGFSLVLAAAPLARPSEPPASPPAASSPPNAVEAPWREADALAALRAEIAGREGEPASRVFKNVKLHVETPAGRLLRVMELGYSRSLGVSCDHCHVAGDWASDEKVEKRIARQMILLTRELNDQRLPAIPELAGREAAVNCTTCHRGETTPALDLGALDLKAP